VLYLENTCTETASPHSYWNFQITSTQNVFLQVKMPALWIF